VVALVFLLLLIVAVLAALLYLFVFFREVPEALEERLGRLEEPGEPIGVWRPDRSSSRGRAALADGELRETRLWEERSGFGRPRLIRQGRYRAAETNEIVRVDPDEVVPRRRVRR
jgi:hypothetical protein